MICIHVNNIIYLENVAMMISKIYSQLFFYYSHKYIFKTSIVSSNYFISIYKLNIKMIEIYIKISFSQYT